jgi:hypothetical protein
MHGQELEVPQYDDGAATCGSANTRDKSSEEGSGCSSVIIANDWDTDKRNAR